MTYKTDPSRWTDSLAEAPDVLRAPFAAARNEGPSDLQVKALALKLAALSAGTAVAATAASAKAATTTAGGATVATAGTFSMAKVVVSVALVGASVTSAVVWQGKMGVRQARQESTVEQTAPEHAAHVTDIIEGAPEVVPQGASAVRTQRTVSGAAQVASTQPSETSIAGATSADDASNEQALHAESTNEFVASRSLSAPKLSGTSVTTKARVSGRTSDSSMARAPARKSHAPAAEAQVGGGSEEGRLVARSTEVDLLRRARAALTNRPREAFAITQEHRQQHPGGVFAQERDALAIEALVRAGEMSTAKGLAERFVREYPSSPHAHRFVETMNLR